MNYPKLANDLMTSLELSLPPIAVSFCDVVPPDVASFDGVVPAGCVFWQEAATRTFAASTKDHEKEGLGETGIRSTSATIHGNVVVEIARITDG